MREEHEMTNSDADTNVPTNFTPIPKRFMVWDKVDKKFLDDPSKACAITPLGALITHPNMVICQSTNLFDTDGEEIFEGSVISSHSGDLVGVVKQHKSGEWRIWWDNIENGSTTLSEPNVYPLTLVGHILSNPELLEEK